MCYNKIRLSLVTKIECYKVYFYVLENFRLLMAKFLV